MENVAQYHGGTLAAFSAMVGVLQAEATETGALIDFSLQAAQAANLDRSTTGIMSYQYAGREFKRMDPSSVSGSIWPCSDGYLEFAIGAMGFERVAALVGQPGLVDDPRFATPEARGSAASVEALGEIVLSWTVQRPMTAAWDVLQQFKIPSGAIYSEGDVLGDRKLRERGYWAEVPLGESAVRVPGRPVVMDRTPWQLRRAAPALGEHNRDVFAELLGVGDEELSRLQAEGVI
jgi:crotonobetainyl-CoA:carnitine CoA-transferase CaiB-like acyl-CoA transferase